MGCGRVNTLAAKGLLEQLVLSAPVVREAGVEELTANVRCAEDSQDSSSSLVTIVDAGSDLVVR